MNDKGNDGSLVGKGTVRTQILTIPIPYAIPKRIANTKNKNLLSFQPKRRSNFE